jgi:hypothetical protein
MSGTLRPRKRDSGTYLLVPDADAIQCPPDGGYVKGDAVRSVQLRLKVVEGNGRILFDESEQELRRWSGMSQLVKDGKQGAPPDAPALVEGFYAYGRAPQDRQGLPTS